MAPQPQAAPGPTPNQRYVDNIRDVRVSSKETLIRSLEAGKLVVHRKLPRSESLKDCMDRTIPYWTDTIVTDAIDAGTHALSNPSPHPHPHPNLILARTLTLALALTLTLALALSFTLAPPYPEP